MDEIAVKKRFAVLFFLFVNIAIAGCIGQDHQGRNLTSGNNFFSASYSSPEALCIDTCQLMLLSGRDMSNGPCLLNPMPSPYEKWVCDVAHSPRWNIDNLPENQCSAYRRGNVTNFVEVDPNCNLIRIVSPQ